MLKAPFLNDSELLFVIWSHRGIPASLTVAAHQRSSNKNRSRVLTSWTDENEAGTAAPWDYPMFFLVLTQEKDNYNYIKSYKCVKIGFQENFINRLISIDRFLCCFCLILDVRNIETYRNVDAKSASSGDVAPEVSCLPPV